MVMRKNYRCGFSLVELMVVLAIFSVITGIILNNAPEFRDKTSLELVAQNIALNIRGAQVYGAGTKVIGTDAPQSFGIHFNQGQKTNFLLFADLDSNDRYSNIAFDCQNNECLELYKLRGAKIYRICIGSGNNCTFLDEIGPAAMVDIIYTRPQSEADFCIRSDYSSPSCLDSYTSASSLIIGIANNKEDKFREVTVWRNGQIEVSEPIEL